MLVRFLECVDGWVVKETATFNTVNVHDVAFHADFITDFNGSDDMLLLKKACSEKEQEGDNGRMADERGKIVHCGGNDDGGLTTLLHDNCNFFL